MSKKKPAATGLEAALGALSGVTALATLSICRWATGETAAVS